LMMVLVWWPGGLVDDGIGLVAMVVGW